MGTISHHHRSAAPELDAGRHTPVSRWRRRSINSLRATIALLAAACFTASDFKSRNVRAPGNTLTGIWNAAPLTTAVCGALTAQDAVAADSQPPDRQPETYCRHGGFGFVNAPQQARRIRTRETVVRVRQKSPWIAKTGSEEHPRSAAGPVPQDVSTSHVQIVQRRRDMRHIR
jgi:hypothetical protein